MPNTDLDARMHLLLAKDAVHEALSRYMALCDVPVGGRGELADLFEEDAVWEGLGGDYAATFGRCEGRESILAMLEGYLPPHPHFMRNAHLVSTGTVEVAGETADGEWMMLQLSAYQDGTAELIAARIRTTFKLRTSPDRDVRATIAHFTTERLFAAPLDAGPLQRAGLSVTPSHKENR